MRPRPLARVVLEQRVDVTLRLREIDALTLDVLARELGLSKGDVVGEALRMFFAASAGRGAASG